MLVNLVEFFLDTDGRERFPDWLQELGSLANQSPGFIDVRPMTPLDGSDRVMFVVIFDTLEHVQRWVDSPVRAELIARITPYWTKPSQLQQFAAGQRWMATA